LAASLGTLVFKGGTRNKRFRKKIKKQQRFKLIQKWRVQAVRCDKTFIDVIGGALFSGAWQQKSLPEDVEG
jgi:hypothetical protein